MFDKMIYTTGEVANLLHIHQTTVIDWAKKGLVKAYTTPGGHRRIQRESLIQFLHSHKMPVPSELEQRVKLSEHPNLGEHRRPKAKK
jgi:excisionase family DNA binding protein